MINPIINHLEYVMLPSLLVFVYFGLLIFSYLVSTQHKKKIERFLNQTPAIEDWSALDAFKTIARSGMYTVLIQISVVVLSLGIVGLLLWLKGPSIGITLGGLGLAIGYAGEVGKLEDQTKLLECRTPALEQRYQEVIRLWKEKAFPDF
jgi:hypothetical protein